ncbi:MAG: ATP-binding protein [Methanobrevibacter sp.]|jgi:hypothetical protein|nr:ATP-binding protein [Methanobrevibacter sp.]
MEKDIRGKLSLGIADFSSLIERNKIYIDKTMFIKKMLDHDETYYFLSRPRRFGKTLLVSTLENFFQGKKELFKNTYIYDKYDWNEKYPVIRISMKKVSNESPEILKKDLLGLTEIIADKNNIKLIENVSYIVKFGQLIEKLAENNNNNVVVLIDEYDAPILKNLSNLKIANKNREILQEFYNVLKESEEYLKFVFITGLSKFTKVSVFSTFNNLSELTLDENYSNICGISHEELKNHYKDHIQVMADKNNYSCQETLDKINKFYDGYSWDGKNRVFNPYSTLNALSQKKFQSFWFSTGTPGFISEIFKTRKITEDYFKPTVLKATDLDAIDIDNINETTLLFQSGYLTIEKEFIENDEFYYSLRIPNFEVEQAYRDNLLKIYLNEVEEDIIDSHDDLWNDIKNGICESLVDYLMIQFDEIPYYLNITNKRDRWKVKQTIFLTLLKHLGFKIRGEVAISHGRIDAVFKDKKHVAITEIKYTQDQKKSIDDLVNQALNQIHEKQYYRLYKNKKYMVILLALAFKDVKINKKDILTDVKCKVEMLTPKS